MMTFVLNDHGGPAVSLPRKVRYIAIAVFFTGTGLTFQNLRRATDLPFLTVAKLSLIDAPRQRERARPRDGQTRLTLDELTRDDYGAACPSMEFEHVQNIVASPQNAQKSPEPRIPHIIHQTSKSRCLTKRLAECTEEWKKRLVYDHNWSYYFHDDDAVNRLLRQNFPDFPRLHPVLSCIRYGTVKADLWRYVVLWEYGGLYSDLDAQPALFNHSSLSATTDAFFVVEQYHLLSQYFMAVSPKHPLMYYAIQKCLSNLLKLEDIYKLNAAYETGPHALHAGYRQFAHDAGVEVTPAGVGYKPVRRGVFPGTHNRTISVEGHGEFEGEYVVRESIRRIHKKRQYAAMNMTHFTQDFSDAKTSGISCIGTIRRTPNMTIPSDYKA